MSGACKRRTLSDTLRNLAATGLLAAGILAACLIAPTEATMGHVQRILYVHVAVAWFALLSFVVMAATGLMYLVRRQLKWDHWSQAAGKLGWLCSSLTLLTGSFWAHEAWGTWWTWDPRLTTAFVLWAIYSGYLIVRAGLEDPHRRARLSAVVAILGLLDVPLVILATRWFRGVHPVSPEMEPAMRIILLLCVLGFSAFFALLLGRRRLQLDQEDRLASLEQEIAL